MRRRPAAIDALNHAAALPCVWQRPRGAGSAAGARQARMMQCQRRRLQGPLCFLLLHPSFLLLPSLPGRMRRARTRLRAGERGGRGAGGRGSGRGGAAHNVRRTQRRCRQKSSKEPLGHSEVASPPCLAATARHATGGQSRAAEGRGSLQPLRPRCRRCGLRAAAASAGSGRQGGRHGVRDQGRVKANQRPEATGRAARLFCQRAAGPGRRSKGRQGIDRREGERERRDGVAIGPRDGI